MKLFKEQDEEELKKLIAEVNGSESGDTDEEENFVWYDINDRDTYFVLNTMSKNVYKKHDQVFHCYGRRSNKYLLNYYGFCLQNNKYNTLRFKVNIDFGWRKKKDQPLSKVDEDEEMVVSKYIVLKEHRLRDELFAYIRANLIDKKD